MAITIDWATYVINIPRADMQLIQSTPIEVRQLDITTFHETLRDLEDGFDGIVNPSTHNYAASTEISGVILAQVMEVLAPYTVTFEDGQYAVNVVGGNSNIADRVNINNVGVRTANSAGLQDLSSLQAASFTAGAVSVNPNTNNTGTIYPVGTRAYAVNNMFDAHEIAEQRGLNTFQIMASLTLSTDDYTDGYVFNGDNPTTVSMILLDGVNTTNAEFRNLTISGVFDGNNMFRGCYIGNGTYVSGYIFQCALTGTITLAPNTTLTLLDCYSNVAGSGTPQIDFDSQPNADLAVRNWSGGLRVLNITSTQSDISIDMASGRLYVDSTCTTGSLIVRGVGEVIDQSGAGFTVIDETVNSAIDTSLSNTNDGVRKSSLLIPFTP